MRRRLLLRTLLACATLVVVWLVVAPKTALALPRSGAPICDPRGAITFAPPPQIQDAELSLDIPADCYDVGPLDLRLLKNVDHGRPAPPELSSSQDSATALLGLRLDLVFSERLPVRVLVEREPSRADHDSIDRPPRS
ncbi:MAG: hypothetical protein KIT84_07980 [Labilithrix sp.]|nr:hypothetical protein [Labilithrix sp.]MCW5810936.1 hypothetical protein [Labilithrix sp.]